MENKISHIILFDYYVDGIKYSKFEKINEQINVKYVLKEIYNNYKMHLDIDSVEVYQCKKLNVKIETNIEVDVY